MVADDALYNTIGQGLSALGEDIQSGRFEQVKAGYANDFGDYLFIRAEKKKVE